MKGMAYQLRHNCGDFEVGCTFNCIFLCSHRFQVHFTLTGSDLIVRTWHTSEKSVSEFIPASKLQGDIPDALLIGVIHRYNELSQTLDFYPAPSGWSPQAPRSWSLSLNSGNRKAPHRLSKTDVYPSIENVLSPDCQVSQRITAIFSPLEMKASNLLIIWQQRTATDADGYYDKRRLRISLPRFRLEFFVGHGGALVCEELPGLSVSPIQFAGSLIGLRNKLILHSPDGGGIRKVIIPDGEIKVSPPTHNHRHEVVITPQPHVSYIKSFVYDIDDIVGRIVGDGTLTSWFLLAYLHILTSSHVIDPLLDRTGVQEALDMLASSHSFAFMHLASEHKHILQRISELTPVRTHYPTHLTSMEKVDWHPILSPLVQSDLFAPFVQAILDFGKMQTPFLLPQQSGDLNGDFQYKGKNALRERAEFRNSRYLSSKSTGRWVEGTAYTSKNYLR
jgi:hypothetical protein